MFQSESVVQDKSSLLINIIFCLFPISFILGSLFVNTNLFLICVLGIYYLGTKILTTKLEFIIKLIFIFFLVIILSTSLSLVKTLYLEGYQSIYEIPDCYDTNCFAPIIRFTKSILFFRFFLLLIIIYLLSKYNVLNFKYFFITAAISSIVVSLDIIFQYYFGYNIVGLKSLGFYNTGFFGDELIAGGYIQRFSFFSIFFSIVFFKDKKYFKFISLLFVICVLATGMLFAGNRMPLILFIVGLLLVFLLNIKIKKILLLSLIVLFSLLQLITMTNENYKNHLRDAYSSFYGSVKYIITIPTHFGIQKWNKQERVEQEESLKSKTLFYEVKWESYHRRIFLAAIDTWKENKILGNGIKSFRQDCWKLEGPDVNLGDDILPNKKNRLCSNHPHNYYLEILTETGVVGMVLILIVALMFVGFVLKNFRFAGQITFANFILLSALISLILETLPLKSTGSLFSTNNAAYLIIIASILLSQKNKNKVNNN